MLGLPRELRRDVGIVYAWRRGETRRADRCGVFDDSGKREPSTGNHVNRDLDFLAHVSVEWWVKRRTRAHLKHRRGVLVFNRHDGCSVFKTLLNVAVFGVNERQRESF